MWDTTYDISTVWYCFFVRYLEHHRNAFFGILIDPLIFTYINLGSTIQIKIDDISYKVGKRERDNEWRDVNL